MKRIILNLAPYKFIVLVILLLLGVQAYCDLSLPQYTSDMIDTGIQNHGVEYALPEKMTSEDMMYSTLFMTDDEKNEWTGYYDAQDNGILNRNADEDSLDELSDKFLIPLTLSHQTGNMSEDRFRETIKQSMQASPEQAPEGFDIDSLSLDEIGQFMGMELKTHEAKNEKGVMTTYVDMRPVMTGLIQSGQMNPQQLSTIRDQMEKTVSTVGKNTMHSMGIAFAIDADKAAGVNVDAIQKSFLWKQGFKMLSMAILMLAASICAGFFAARTGAGIGRDLREKIFKKVIGYSNTEID